METTNECIPHKQKLQIQENKPLCDLKTVLEIPALDSKLYEYKTTLKKKKDAYKWRM